ncbi:MULTISPECIES: hypothetical protein [Rhodococcus]|uniref:hypothetical protein n=1 Tax=Rhodococcus TaxID=1827 RepID=UPI00193B1982|nr:MULTISPECIES: hypothetical protein [Rhodococcus]QRI75047.1 hypothetical protein JQ505_21215 [Rhodococcus aetherivorans]QSE58456.1 hypothetical protein JYA75_22320 [Rhodococcus sp. PSBB066]QSE70221.1 hypothetical protein JYA91_05300 [Rhodococcus sp. PSBB049]
MTDLSVVSHPLQLRVRVPHYRRESASCDREVFRHNTGRLTRSERRLPAAAPGTSCDG